MKRVAKSPSQTPPRGVAQRGSIISEPSGDNHARICVKQEETSGLMQKEMEPMKWTNEKHSLYLESMETSFLHQLHNSMDLLGRHSLQNPSSQPKPSIQKLTSKRNPPGQFKIFKDGCSGKIDFSRGEPELNRADESGLLSSNPGNQHYRSGCRQHTRTYPSFQEKDSLANLKDDVPASNFHFGRQDSIGSNTGSSDLSLEGTDQNFIDEDPNEENESRMRSSKRMKTKAVAVPNHDQVVPFSKYSYTEDVSEDNVSSSPKYRTS